MSHEGRILVIQSAKRVVWYAPQHGIRGLFVCVDLVEVQHNFQQLARTDDHPSIFVLWAGHARTHATSV
jgi:hypothetical protein